MAVTTITLAYPSHEASNYSHLTESIFTETVPLANLDPKKTHVNKRPRSLLLSMPRVRHSRQSSCTPDVSPLRRLASLQTWPTQLSHINCSHSSRRRCIRAHYPGLESRSARQSHSQATRVVPQRVAYSTRKISLHWHDCPASTTSGYTLQQVS